MRSLLPLLALLGCGDNNRVAPGEEAGTLPVPDATTGLPRCANPVSGTTVALRNIAKIPDAATIVTSPPDDARLFVVDRSGKIWIVENEQLNPTPFLDISLDNAGPVNAGGEMGLLGLAFDPGYATDREFYVFYTHIGVVGDIFSIDTLARYHVSATDPNVAEPTGTIVLSLRKSHSNHNGGMLEFGSDGDLYIGTGDGGSHGDPNRYAQNPHMLHGKFLRLDVAHRPPGKEYGIPADNPFADGVAGAPEVYMLGLRNPWRWSFDRGTGDLWIGDVGQLQTEELDVLKAGEQLGRNLGWSAYEGSVCCATQTDLCTQLAPLQPCNATGKTFPLAVRTHQEGWAAIIGGQVYRGTCYPDLVGWYFFTDNVHGGMSKARLLADGTLEIVELTGTFPRQPASLHADARGELYETDVLGNVYHLEAGP